MFYLPLGIDGGRFMMFNLTLEIDDGRFMVFNLTSGIDDWRFILLRNHLYNLSALKDFSWRL